MQYVLCTKPKWTILKTSSVAENATRHWKTKRGMQWAGKKNKYSPSGISNFSGYLHLLSGPFINLLQSAGQPILNRRGLTRSTLIHMDSSSFPTKGSKYVITKHPIRKPRPHATAAATTTSSHPSHSPKGAREPEEFSKNIIGVPGIEPKRRWNVPGGIESGSSTTSRSIRRWHLTLQALFPILVIDSSLLRITQHLITEKSPTPQHKSKKHHPETKIETLIEIQFHYD